MRQLCVLIFLLLCLFFVTCSPPNAPPVVRSTGIIGYWNWLETFGVESGLRSTPQSVGYTQTFRFDPDSILYHYRNDTLSLSTRYRITLVETPWFIDTTSSTMLLRTDKWTPFGSQWFVFFNSQDTLTLADWAFDAAIHRFLKKKK